jgi:hypothetical protein
MQLLKRTVPLWVLLAVLAISASVVYATIQIYKDFQISMEIAGVCDMITLDTDRTTEHSSINLELFIEETLNGILHQVIITCIVLGITTFG